MKERIYLCIKSLLTAYAFLAAFHAPLLAEHYETTLDYLIASVYELLGEYDFRLILVGICCGFFYHYLGKYTFSKKNSFTISAGFFAACILLGNSYMEAGSWEYCFGSVVNLIKSLLAFVGYSFFFYGCMQLMSRLLDQFMLSGQGMKTSRKLADFWQERTFLKAFLILIIAYLPFLILSYPGNLCWDVIGQIEQVVFDSGYSSHHPLVHTLIVGGMVKLGQICFGSLEIGLFLYMLLQLAGFGAALAATVWRLKKRGVKGGVLTCIMGIYVLAPVYSNMASTAIKDVPFISCVIGYVICLSMLLEQPKLLKRKSFVCLFVLLQLGTVLFRNNGIYVVCLSGIISVIYLWKRYQWKERMGSIAVLFAVSLVVSKLFLAFLMQILHGTPGSSGEMFSLPFQQTARYLQLYRGELTLEERSSIEAVLGDVDTVAGRYDPDIADPVKALFKKDAEASEILAYFATWMKGFCKHPAVYIEAFFHHVYGWFSPAATNAIRYETQDYGVINQDGLFSPASKLLIFYYRFINRFTPVGVLENAGMYVWVLIFITAYLHKRKRLSQMMMTVPLWISLLICMASPCYIWHPRYAFPIMFTLPFLICFICSDSQQDTLEMLPDADNVNHAEVA